MIDSRHTAYNLAVHSFTHSPYTVLYDPITFDAILVVSVGEKLLPTRLPAYKDAKALSEVVRRQDGTVDLLSKQEFQDVLNRGPMVIESSSVSFVAAVGVPENNYNPHIYLSVFDGTSFKNTSHALSVSDTTPESIKDHNLPSPFESLFVFS